MELELTPKKYEVVVEYCVPCDYSADALQVVEELTKQYQHIIQNLILRMGSKGVFEVMVGGEVLFSKKALRRHPQPGEVLALFKALVGPQVPTYPRP